MTPAATGAIGSRPRTATRCTSAAPTSSSCAPAAGGRAARCTTSTSPARRAPSAACSPAPGVRSTPRSSRVSGLIEPEADAALTRPDIVTRAEWGANRDEGGCKPRTHPVMGDGEGGRDPPHGHRQRLQRRRRRPGSCSASAAITATPTAGTTSATRRWSTASGRSTRGAPAGSRKPVVGAQAQGFNAQTTAIASIGTHTKVSISPEAKASIVNYLAWRLSSAGVQRGRQDDAGVRRRRPEPLSAGPPGAAQEGVRPRDDRAHRLPGRGARAPDPRRSAGPCRRAIKSGGGPDEEPPPPPPDGGTGKTAAPAAQAAASRSRAVGGEEGAGRRDGGGQALVLGRVADHLVACRTPARRWRTRA